VQHALLVHVVHRQRHLHKVRHRLVLGHGRRALPVLRDARRQVAAVAVRHDDRQVAGVGGEALLEAHDAGVVQPAQ
jgi:hypothetical protein